MPHLITQVTPNWPNSDLPLWVTLHVINHPWLGMVYTTYKNGHLGYGIFIVLPTNHCFCFKVKSTNHVRYLATSTGFVWTCHHVPINLGLWLLRSTFMLCNFWWIHIYIYIYIWPAKEFMFCRIRITTILSSDIHMLYHCFTVNPSLL